MKLFVLSIIFASLQASEQNPTSQWTLLPNVLVFQVDGTFARQPLSCVEQPEDLMRSGNQSQDIIWKKNGVEEQQRGNVYLVQLEESRGGGNYTCHTKSGSLLNHTVVLIDAIKKRRILVKTEQEDYLKCSAQNYNGEFRCVWTWHSFRVGKVAFIKARRTSEDDEVQCSVDSGEQRWTCSSGHRNFSCSVDDGGNGISCRDEQHCPYAEEVQRIHITLYVKTKEFLLENYSKLFYLSEIVKPDKVRIGQVNTTVVQWSYPSSWNSPYSYFPLTFQIAQLKGGCRKCDHPCFHLQASKTSTVHSIDNCQIQVKRKAKVVCVRAQDALCNSQWSEWSHVRLTNGRKNKKHKQTTNIITEDPES